MLSSADHRVLQVIRFCRRVVFFLIVFRLLSPFLPPLPAPHSHLLGKGSSGLGFGEAGGARCGRLLVLGVKLPVFRTPAALGVTHDHSAVGGGSGLQAHQVVLGRLLHP